MRTSLPRLLGVLLVVIAVVLTLSQVFQTTPIPALVFLGVIVGIFGGLLIVDHPRGVA